MMITEVCAVTIFSFSRSRSLSCASKIDWKREMNTGTKRSLIMCPMYSLSLSFSINSCFGHRFSFHLRERFLKRERINRRLGPKAIRSLKNTLSWKEKRTQSVLEFFLFLLVWGLQKIKKKRNRRPQIMKKKWNQETLDCVPFILLHFLLTIDSILLRKRIWCCQLKEKWR